LVETSPLDIVYLQRVTAKTKPLPRATKVSTARWLGRQDPLVSTSCKIIPAVID